MSWLPEIACKALLELVELLEAEVAEGGGGAGGGPVVGVGQAVAHLGLQLNSQGWPYNKEPAQLQLKYLFFSLLMSNTGISQPELGIYILSVGFAPEATRSI